MLKLAPLSSAFSASLRFNRLDSPRFSFVSLSLCASVLKIFAFLHPCAFALSPSRGFLPHIRCNSSANCAAADTREPTAALSGISLTSRRAEMPFQRHPPSLPPVIAAELLQNLHKLQNGLNANPSPNPTPELQRFYNDAFRNLNASTFSQLMLEYSGV